MSAFAKDIHFGNIGYSCILSHEMNIFYSDNDDLFRSLCRNRKITLASIIGQADSGLCEHRFTYEGVRFRAIFVPVYNNNFLCSCYPEDCFIKRSFSDMYNNVSDIRRRSMILMTSLTETIDEFHENEMPPGYLEKAEEQLASAEAIYTETSDILRMFDVPQKFEYVLITELLKDTSNRIAQFSETAGRTVVLESDIDCGVARINYMLLEAVILELAGLLLEIIERGRETVLRVYGRKNEPLRISSRAPFKDDRYLRTLERSVKLVKCSVSALGGESRIHTDEGYFYTDVRIPASLSNLFCRVKDKKAVSRASKGYDKIFTSSAGKDLALRSCVKSYSVSCSMTLANIILEPLARKLSSV